MKTTYIKVRCEKCGENYQQARIMVRGTFAYQPDLCDKCREENDREEREEAMRDVMEGVREYGEGEPVKLYVDVDGRWVIKAVNEGGFNSTEVDLMDLLGWLKKNKPELLK